VIESSSRGAPTSSQSAKTTSPLRPGSLEQENPNFLRNARNELQQEIQKRHPGWPEPVCQLSAWVLFNVKYRSFTRELTIKRLDGKSKRSQQKRHEQPASATFTVEDLERRRASHENRHEMNRRRLASKTDGPAKPDL
jgi:hypothetical protein